MRGDDSDNTELFSYVSLESRIPVDHPLRPIGKMANAALRSLSPELGALYAKVGRPSIPPERILRALLLQILYSIRSERLLVEQLDCNFLYAVQRSGSRRLVFHLRTGSLQPGPAAQPCQLCLNAGIEAELGGKDPHWRAIGMPRRPSWCPHLGSILPLNTLSQGCRTVTHNTKRHSSTTR